MKQVKVFVGNFGSGKTELALNFAVNAAKARKKTLLVDLDIINPYFRSVERSDVLAAAGVRLIHPIFARTTVDVPSLPPDIYSAFLDDSELVVFDVGGDPAGATALGQYKEQFSALPQESLEVLYVVNPRRPFSSTAEQIIDLYQRIVQRARLNATGLVNNANLSVETTGEDLLFGYSLVAEASRALNVPVRYTSGRAKTLEEFAAAAKARGLDPRYIGELFPITTYMHRDWDTFAEKGM